VLARGISAAVRLLASRRHQNMDHHRERSQRDHHPAARRILIQATFRGWPFFLPSAHVGTFIGSPRLQSQPLAWTFFYVDRVVYILAGGGVPSINEAA